MRTAARGTSSAWPDTRGVVGVTSWGTFYEDGASAPPKQVGASPFLSGTVKALMDSPNGACATYPAACER